MKTSKLVSGVFLMLVFLTANAFADNFRFRMQGYSYFFEDLTVGSSQYRRDENQIEFLLEVCPASFLISPEADDFEITSSLFIERVAEFTSWIPTARAGICFDTPAAKIDVTGGAGLLWNELFTAPMFLVDVAARFKLRENVTLGPHFGIVNFSKPDWDGFSDVRLSDSTGVMAGLALTAGNHDVLFSLSVDYLEASFDITTGGDWTANRTSLDMSGLAVQLGLMLRF